MGSIIDMTCQIMIINLPICTAGSLHHSDSYSTVRLTVCLAWLVLLCCADSQSGMSFSEAQQLARPLPPLAKNTKQDASLSSDTSHFKPSLWMQAHSQSIGVPVSGAEAEEIKPQLFMSGCVPACGHVVIVLFQGLHVCISVFLLPTCLCIYVMHV